ncbi:hypothetical protein M2A_1813 [Tepidicaulis marinus]|uniref:Uncharacterized protein n=1 Tax=Tepidicaulis marinus TaxID=1333998 RepID=A0A081BB96_9HYPH|nr:hypothetical protein M2A_1813 [Tepidicaulis marinus]
MPASLRLKRLFFFWKIGRRVAQAFAARNGPASCPSACRKRRSLPPEKAGNCRFAGYEAAAAGLPPLFSRAPLLFAPEGVI